MVWLGETWKSMDKCFEDSFQEICQALDLDCLQILQDYKIAKMINNHSRYSCKCICCDLTILEYYLFLKDRELCRHSPGDYDLWLAVV